MTEIRRFSLVIPTVGTCFHIDYDWWKRNDRDWRVYLRSNLCPEHQEAFRDMDSQELVDWVDPDTAEVQRVDGMQHVLITHCAKQAGFITKHSTLVDAVFRLFLANGNVPLTISEIGERLERPPKTILNTLAGARVYRGLRPCTE